jgi:sulfotransferase family protein
MSSDLNLLMISAMYENGGNTTHRLFDGHPQMFVYPMESQLGTRFVNDLLNSTFPSKYRWPAFQLNATPSEDYRAIIDEEVRVRARTPHVSKFRHVTFEMDDVERGRMFQEHVARTGRGPGENVAAFFRATFEAWKNHNRSGRETLYVGYSPIIIIDAEKILRDMPKAHMLHIVRNPWSAYADTLKRPVPMSIENYTLAWCLNQYYALLCQRLFPSRVSLLRLEDIVADPAGTLGGICRSLGLDHSDTLGEVSWNGEVLDEVYPWGMIRTPTLEANRVTARELNSGQIEAIRARTEPYLAAFDYTGFVE